MPSIPMKTVQPTAQHKQFNNDMIAVISKHKDMPRVEMLALAAQFVGRLVALQDQTKVSPGMAMTIVSTNLEVGNKDAIETFLGNVLGNA